MGNRKDEQLWVRRFFGKVVGATLLITLSAVIVHATLPDEDSVKLLPLSLSVSSEPSLPAEVKALEAQTIKRLFDQDTTTLHTAFDSSQITANLEGTPAIHAIKVYGAAPYRLNVFVERAGVWAPLEGLQGLDLTRLADAWHRFPLAAATTADRLRFELTPASGSAASGLKELEIWGQGSSTNVTDARSLLAAMRRDNPPAHGRLYNASPKQGSIGALTGTPPDDATDNRFSFDLNREPQDFARAYLVYETMNITHWVNAGRSINGRPVQGGFKLPVGDDWFTQIEEINPAWLQAGSNTIDFSLVGAVEGSYIVRNVRLLGALSNGSDVKITAVSLPQAPGNPVATVLDGDLTSGWSPYPRGIATADYASELILSLNRPLQLDGLKFYLRDTLKGNLTVQVQQNGAWVDSGLPPIPGRKLVSGWNFLPGVKASATTGVKLRFEDGIGSSATLQELSLSGSPVGADAPVLNITYPEAGQFYGRNAYIRGFLTPHDNGSGLAQLTIGGKAVPHTDGAFGVVVTKDDVGFATQSDSEPWSVELLAVYPNGKRVTATVVLNRHRDAVMPDEARLPHRYSEEVEHGRARKMRHDEAHLDLDAQALSQTTTIGIRPLTDRDMPKLDPGMTNVTKGPRRGYRFTPHPMKFKNKIKVTLPYDIKKIPKGMTEQDVKIYYFDDGEGRWKELSRLSHDSRTSEIVSETDHFTDMIAATITVPDHPNPASFNPTSIKDIKAADPGSQINLIEAPRANNTGDARLSYPIELPPGRQGLQPQLAVQYNSSGGNGWMGMGWDIAMQAVTIDTRFGVPRYDASQETETYLLSGEQLTPVAHRGDLQPRTAEKIFHTRVEGQFRKIVRHGNRPANYTWEVTDKNGVKYLYGATNPATETLTDGAGNIFLWALCEVRDPNGNFVRYHYARVNDTGVASGGVPGSNIYLQRITYTGHGATEGAYSVTFVRDRDLGETLRVDKQIDARGGFKRVTADLLRRVEVSLGDQLIRRYEMQYAEGAFRKTLLQRVLQYGEDGVTEFNRHNFSYYDEARDTGGNYRGFEGSTDWSVGNDNVSAGLLGRGAASALGGNRSTSTGAHIYVGVGSAGNTSSKQITGGVKVGYSRSKSESLLAMADMNGDGLPDKVFKGGGGFSYRPNLSGPHGSTGFGEPVNISGLPAISRETVTSTTVGGEFFFGLALLIDRNVSVTQADTYFTDVNGDGLTDLVSGGQVLFGFINAAGVPAFSANSADTPVPIGAGAVNTQGLLEDATALEAERATAFPLLDTVRRWVAPYDGVVRIDAPVRLVQDTSEERAQYTRADGVRVAIQLEGAELWSTTIAQNNYAEHIPAGVTAIPVTRGDRIYFRVQSVFDGAYDQVAWDPEIKYLSVDTARTDVNSLPVYRYRASQDFTLAGRRASITAPLNGMLHLGGRFEKTGVTTDDVTLLITRNGADVFRRTLRFAETAIVDISRDVTVAHLDVLEWRVLVDSPIDATRIKFSPTAYYTAAEGVDDVTDEHGNFVLQLNPPYDIDLYPVNMLSAPQGHYVAPAAGTLAVEARLQVSGIGPTSAVFTVKRRGALLAKRPIAISGAGEFIVTANVTANMGDQLFFDLSSRDTAFPSRLTAFTVTAGGNTVPAALHVPAVEGLFPQPYRGWVPFGYNGNGERATQPIDQSVFLIDETFTAENARVYPFGPRPLQMLWQGPDDLAWVKAGEMSSSRLGLDDIRMPRSEDFAGASAVPRMSRSINNSVSLGLGASEGDSRSQLDFQDLNGDRFPDVLGQGGVQYTRMTGGLESGIRDAGLGTPRESRNESLNIGTSGLGSIAKAVANARGSVAPQAGKPAAGATQGTDMPGLGFGGDVGKGSSDTKHDLIDMNGDGLPDKVFEDGSVALNLGYRFASAEAWGGGIVNNGETTNAGVNIGYNSDAYSIAGGLNLGIGTTRSDETYADINGDGLPDKIVAGSPLSVRLNTGSGFTAPISWPGGHNGVAVDKNVSLGGGVYFTFGFNILLVRVVVNPGINFSTAMGRPELSFRDVDGDGYADHLFSERDRELKVARNPIGRTNLLKHIARPLGATIDLEYTRDGNTYDLPQSRWVLSKTTVFDGVAGDGVDNQVTTYKYEGGFHNRLEREFYGYKKVTEEQRNAAAGDALYRSTSREYFNDNFYTKGFLKRELTVDNAARPFLETENTYILRNVETGTEPADASSTTATLFPMLVRSERRFYEGGSIAQKSTHTRHEYDTLGNITEFFDAGDLGATDDVLAKIDYSHCTSSYIVGKPTQIQVHGNGTLMRRRTSDIDCGTGNVRQVAQHFETGQAVTDLSYEGNGNLKQVIGPSNKRNQRYTHTYEYDSIVATHITRIQDSFALSSQASYNFKHGKAETTTDTNNNQTTYAYDQFGRITTITGPYEQGSGLATLQFEYHPEATVPWALTRHLDRFRNVADTLNTVLFTDGLKRVLQTKKDGAVATGGADGAAQDVMIVSGRMTFDFIGRTIAQHYPVTESLGLAGIFNPTFDGIQPTRMEYDVLDRNTKTVLPDGTSTTIAYGFGTDRSGETQFLTTVTDANNIQKRTYRDINQAITSIQELNRGATLWTSYLYDGLKQIVKIIDDKNNTTTVAYDNLGRRTVIDNPDTGKTETVYDQASNVIAKITANLRAEGKRVEYDYDFNRLTAIRYPIFKRNNVKYEYGAPGATDNRAGRITMVSDASGKEERFYGKLGEIVKEIKTLPFSHHDHGHHDGRRHVAHFGGGDNDDDDYDDDRGDRDDRDDQDERDRDRYRDRDHHHKVRRYITQYLYDTFGRLQQLTFPDKEVLTYRYNSGGLVESASGKKYSHTLTYLNKLSYDKFEERVFLHLGNGAKTNYTYRADNRRLENLASITIVKHHHDRYDRDRRFSVPAVPMVFQNLTYNYDPVGNIVKRVNDVPVKHHHHDDHHDHDGHSEHGDHHEGGHHNGPSTQTYRYDDLYRLTEAEGLYRSHHDHDHGRKRKDGHDDHHNHHHRYALALTYDSIHNIVDKNLRTGDGHHHHDDDDHRDHDDHEGHHHGYEHHYTYAQKPHAPVKIGRHRYAYDANGNQIHVSHRKHDHDRRGHGHHDDDGHDHHHRHLVWDEENRLACVFNEEHHEHERERHHLGQLLPHRYERCHPHDNKHGDREVHFVYNDKGERAIKEGDGTTFYINSNYTRKEGQHAYKHIFIGQSRLVTRAVEHKDHDHDHDGHHDDHDPHLFYYHADHLGSTHYVTDGRGRLHEHMEYLPFGETWINDHGHLPIGFKFTAKELDPETGLYYYGARYYDPRTSVWISPDPILGKYLPTDEATSHLPGFGGVFNSRNLGLYGYGQQNPVLYNDPDGNVAKLFVTVVKIAIKGGDIYSTVSGIVDNAKTIMDPNASIGEKLLAAADIALDVGTGINTRDIKAAAKAVDGAKDKIKSISKGTSAPIHGNAQVTKKGGKETTHASTSERYAKEEAARPDAESVHMNQTLETISGGAISSQKRPDVATVRKDGKIDITEVLSRGQTEQQMKDKYKGILGDKAGEIRAVPSD